MRGIEEQPFRVHGSDADAARMYLAQPSADPNSTRPTRHIIYTPYNANITPFLALRLIKMLTYTYTNEPLSILFSIITSFLSP